MMRNGGIVPRNIPPSGSLTWERESVIDTFLISHQLTGGVIPISPVMNEKIAIETISIW